MFGMVNAPATTDEIIRLIEFLQEKDKARLFKSLFRHPENKPVKDFIAKANGVISSSEKLLKNHKKARSLSELVIKAKLLRKFLKTTREHCDLETEMLEHIRKATEEKSQYTKGPQARAEKARIRREKIKHMMNGGMKDAGSIRRALARQEIDVKLKTVQNDMSAIRSSKS
jgi:hypothetical protein